MKFLSYFSILLCFLTTACHAGNYTPQASTITTKSTTSLDGILKQGMAYADLRKAVLSRGWAPKIDPQCVAHLAGPGHETLCSANPEIQVCTACDHLPELSESGNSGNSRMWFQNAAGDKLEVVANGMLKDWNVSADSRLSVSWWLIHKRDHAGK